jgi:uncharacterized protein (DUF1015 family)
MPRLIEFSGLRYNPSQVSLNEVIAPPYDVVNEQARAQLIAKSPYNSIRVELPEPETQISDDRYEVAKQLLASWLDQGILKRDLNRCLYGYSMTFMDESGNERSTTGVFGGLELAGADEGQIMPHEETMPKPKGDRLFLLSSTRANLSPIWGLSLGSGLSQACEYQPGIDGDKVSARDEDGTTHAIWPISDPSRIESIKEIIASKPVVIADGHHRFETALAFNNQDQSDGQVSGGSGAVFAFVVELVPDQLLVRPIHRIVSGLDPDIDALEYFGGSFAIEPCDLEPAKLTPQYLEKHKAIALVTKQGCWLMRDPMMASSGRFDGDVLMELDSVRLRSALEKFGDFEIAYEAKWDLALDSLDRDLANFVVMIRPVTVDQIGRAAQAGLRMPPKTTYFHPKPRTGMVFRPIDDQ